MVLITGADGFVGTALRARFAELEIAVRCAVRTPAKAAGTREERVVVGELGPKTAWSSALEGVDVVVHLAARVHVMREAAIDPLAAFRAINVEGTRNLALQAAAACVRRFVFLSSVKVNGETTAGRAFTESDPPHPEDPYGASKRDAEVALREVAAMTSLEVMILRPPLVYGPGVKANFLRMMRWVNRGVPLPLAAIRNSRSLIYVGNLVDAIMLCLDHPAAAGETFLADDGAPVSTSQLLREIGEALGRPARLFPVPPALLQGAATVMGRGGDAARLLGDLVVDSSRMRRILGWQPPYTRGEGLADTVDWFRGLPTS